MLGSREGSFNDLASLCECVKASCMLPGVAGVEPPWLKGSSAQNPELLKQGLDQFLRQEVEASRSGELWSQAREAFVKQMQMRQRGVQREAPATSALQRIFVQSADTKNLTELPGMNKTELFAALLDRRKLRRRLTTEGEGGGGAEEMKNDDGALEDDEDEDR